MSYVINIHLCIIPVASKGSIHMFKMGTIVPNLHTNPFSVAKEEEVGNLGNVWILSG